jgi:UPF0271 protein
MAVSINCDMGEAFSIYHCGDDAGIMPHISMANVACGFHAADPAVMRATVRLAKRFDVKVGAHPSYPDLQGFGRREMKMDRDELAACIIYQVGALKAFLDAEGMPLNHIKPHGALYLVASREEMVAEAICDAAEIFAVPLLGMAYTVHERVYTRRNIGFISEYYGDLDYADDGSLIVTRTHLARDADQAATRALRAVEQGKAVSMGGRDLPVRADSVCVHSDTPGAVEIVKQVRRAIASYMK